MRADALGLLAEAALHHALDPGAPGERYQVVVHVDAAVLADAAAPGQSVLEDGARVPAGTSQRLACDASRVVMRHDAEGRVVEVGARTRTIPPALRRALQHRDGGCRFPGCGVRVGQGHHIRHWAQGGPTTLTNLLICADSITARCTRRASRSSASRTVSCGSAGRMGDPCRTCRRPSRSPAIHSECCEPGPRPRDSICTRTRRRQGGLVNVWTWATRSTCCIRLRARCHGRRHDRRGARLQGGARPDPGQRRHRCSAPWARRLGVTPPGTPPSRTS